MPSDALTVAVTTGLGVSVLAGILSGICYILTHGLPNTRARSPITPWHCNVCGQQFRSIQGILEVEKVVTCAKCRTKVCRVRCSKRDSRRGWICQNCQQPENWFTGLLKSIHPNKEWSSNSMDLDDGDELDEDLLELRKKEREQVREFIEKLVEAMLGGDLDNVSVSRIYNDKKYLPITGQSPCSAHAYLKQLIQRFASEAADLPSLSINEDHPAHPEEAINNRTYEDLLSTAIINRVIQTNQNDARSSTNSSRASATTRKLSDNKEYFFGEETLENKWKNQNSVPDDVSSTSSLDDWVRSDSSVASSKFVDRVSLTIKQQIEEGTSSDDESLSNASHTQENAFLHSTDESWHENWYFQKRRFTKSNSPVPVPMLVPNPIIEAKVLIGDKEAEELSDIDSDYGDPEIAPDIKNILVNSKTIIGGKNAIPADDDTNNAFHTIEDSPGTCATAEGSDDRLKDSQTENEICKKDFSNTNVEDPSVISERATQKEDVRNLVIDNILLIPEPCNEDTSLLSIESNTEQDTEYTEQYASLTKTFLKNSAPVSRQTREYKQYSNDEGAVENGFKNAVNAKAGSDSSDSDDERIKVFEGSYSEREKEKWKHSSVEIPDNPYSPENLERRLSSRSSNGSNSPMFGRDYYVKNAAKSAGARSPGKILGESESFEYSSTYNGNGNNLAEAETFTAVPAIVNEVNSNEFESTTESPVGGKPITHHDISSDSDLSIERVYNLQSGKVFEKKGNIRHEIPSKPSYSPEGLKYMPKEFDEDTKILSIDENHNNAPIHSNKQAFMRSLTENEDEDCDKLESTIGEQISAEDEKFIDTVPYDATKFKAALEKFMTDLDIAKDNEAENSSMIASADTTETQNLKSNSVNPDISKSFGEVKNNVDKINTSDYSEEELLSENREFSLEYSTDIYADDISKTESSLETDPEIIDLKEKGLVKDILGKFSQSYSNISSTHIGKIDLELSQSDLGNQEEIVEKLFVDDVDTIPSVKNLKQLFDKDDTASSSPNKKDSKQIYSLTARSLPRQFRQKLRSDEETSIQHEEDTTDQKIIDEEAEVLPIDITKNMIAFYEHLKSTK